MKAFQFFMDYFGKHFINPSDNLEADVKKVLSMTHERSTQKSTRLTMGMAIIKPSETVTSVNMERKGISHRTLGFKRITWTNEPMMVLHFNKNDFDLHNLFITYHPKHVVICRNNSNRIIEIDS